MKNFIYLIIVIVFIIILNKIINNFSLKNSNKEKIYTKKKLMTDCEYNFYIKLRELEKNYKIVPQLNLAAVITKKSHSYNYLDLFRNIDFAIFNNDYSELLLLIELNDKTHNYNRRKKRDRKVKEICDKANIKLINFYTKYPNEKNYVINRILSEINKNQKG